MASILFSRSATTHKSTGTTKNSSTADTPKPMVKIFDMMLNLSHDIETHQKKATAAVPPTILTEMNPKSLQNISIGNVVFFNHKLLTSLVIYTSAQLAYGLYKLGI